MQKVASIVFSLLALLLVAPVVLAQAGADVGKAVHVSGDVYVIRGAERLVLTEGDGVLAADTVMTGSRGRVSLLMHDDSRIHVGRLSRLSLSDYALKEKSLVSGALDLLWGKVRFFVARLSDGSGFSVSTRTAVLGVRGTEFVVIVPVPEGVADPTVTALPPSLPDLVTTVYGVEGVVEGVSTSGRRVLIGPGVKVEFSRDGKVKFTSPEKPLSVPVVKPGSNPAPEIPDVPKPTDIIVPTPPEPPVRGGQLTIGW